MSKRINLIFVITILCIMAAVCLAIPQASAAEGDEPIRDISFVSSNATDSQYCKPGDSIVLTFTVNTDVSVTQILIADQPITPETNGNTYTATYRIPDNFDKDTLNFSVMYETNGTPGTYNGQTENEIVFYNTLTVDNITYQSNNSENASVATDGNTVVFSFVTNHPITNNPVISIGGNEITLTSEQRENGIFYQCEYTVDGKGLTDGEVIPLLNDALTHLVDAAGNTVELQIPGEITYIAPLSVQDVLWYSDSNDSQAAIDGSLLTFSFSTNHEIMGTAMIAIDGTEIPLETTENNNTVAYKAQYQVASGNFTDGAIIVPDLSQLQLKDAAGNTATIDTPEGITYHSPLAVSDILFHSNAQNPTVAVNASELTFQFTTNRQIENIGSVRIGGQIVELSETEIEGGFTYSGTLSVNPSYFSDGDIITVDTTNLNPLQDAFGNYTNVTCDEQINYYAPIEISDISFHSDNPYDTQAAINGNTVEFSFKANHEINITEPVEINGQSLELQSIEEGDGIRYRASLAINGGMNDQSSIVLNIESLQTVSDAAGQQASIVCNDSIIYYAPLTDQNIISSDFTCTGNQIESIYYVKNGDTVNFEFESDRLLSASTMNVGGQRVAMYSEDGYHWSGIYSVSNLQDNQELQTLIEITDVYGNSAYTLPENWTDRCIYYAPIVVNGISFSSSNSNDAAIAKNGDTLNLSFTTNHPTIIKSMVIGGQDVSVQTEDNIHYTASVTVIDGMTSDQSSFSLSAMVGDLANNTDVSFDQNSAGNIIYFAPIALSNLSYTSNNENDGTRYAKTGDTVTASLQSNHAVLINGTLAGEATTASSNGNTYTASVAIYDYPDQQAVSFSLTATDRAGNDPVTLTTENVDNTIVYYAPISLSGNIISNNSKNTSYATAGDTITVNLSANHDVSVNNGVVHGFSTSAGESGSSLAISMTMDGGSQGNIAAQVDVIDVAGNTGNLELDSEIIYDDIAPTVQINPVVSGFMNQDIQINAQVEDTNLDISASNVMLNGENQLSSTNGQAAEASFELTEDGTYTIDAQAEDMAGNRAEQTGGTVIIDQTAPEIITTNIDLEDKPAYQEGVVMSDYFTVQDAYLDTVNCLLTHITGLQRTLNWNLDDAINDEGEQAMQLSATDRAQNQSNEVSYGFYTDGTSPRALVTEQVTNTTLSERSVSNIGLNGRLNIELDNIWIGNERPDHFTTLSLENKDTGEVINLLDNQSNLNRMVYQIHEPGSYALTVAAVDDVGNSMENVVYHINVLNEESAYIAPSSLISPWLYVICAAAAMAAVICIALLIKKKKDNDNGDDESANNNA